MPPSSTQETPQDTDAGDVKIHCEFTPCTTPPTNEPTPRKIISHIFGRNKTLTKRVPPHVWVHYCRQHYQRARYRARDWPVTQCQLVLVSLERMQGWGGILGFRVVLRRRALIRGLSPRERERERARSRSPVDAGGGLGGVRVTRSSTSTSISTSASSTSTPRQRESLSASPSSTPTSDTNKTRPKTKKKPNPKRKKPSIPPSPLPAWLRAETHPTQVRSFDEVRRIVERLKGMFEREREGDSPAVAAAGAAGIGVFPDIEILPFFRD